MKCANWLPIENRTASSNPDLIGGDVSQVGNQVGGWCPMRRGLAVAGLAGRQRYEMMILDYGAHPIQAAGQTGVPPNLMGILSHAGSRLLIFQRLAGCRELGYTPR